MEIKYEVKSLVNDYGTGYGVDYIIESAPEGVSFEEAAQYLLDEIIGYKEYYRPRDVWDQIAISEGVSFGKP